MCVFVGVLLGVFVEEDGLSDFKSQSSSLRNSYFQRAKFAGHVNVTTLAYGFVFIGRCVHTAARSAKM